MPAGEIRAVALVSAAHFVSHYYPLLLPPLFPLLRDVYGVGYTELGLAITAHSLTSTLLQAPVGFAVDRFGARTILVIAVLVEAAATALIGLFPSYFALLLFSVVAGAANSVFHPADYSILNASVGDSRMGRAFSLHTAAGYAGNALAPMSVLLLAAVVGWQGALMLLAVPGVLIALAIWANLGVLRDSVAPREISAAGTHAGAGIALLFSAPVLTGLLFFFGLSMASNGVHGFGVAALDALYAIPVETAGLLLSVYLVASPVGVLAGGWLADRIRRHDLLTAVCFIAMAAAMAAVAAMRLPLALLSALLALVGFLAGLISPSRDMLVRAMTPPGQFGKVFGFVTTGFSLAGVIAPPLFGLLLDHGGADLLFFAIAGIYLLTIGTVLETGRRARGYARR